jgi:predicted MFS family arabinose efflux permease
MAQPILRAIAFCAFAWNCAFVALNAYFPTWAKSTLGWTIGEAGLAVGGYGAGGLIGAYLAPRIIKRFGPAFVFVLGPLGSTLGALTAVTLSPFYGPKAGFLGFMILGSTAMMWLVLQTTVRQLITPPQLLGRVAATLTTAIYGIRPLGAQLAGLVAALASPYAALWLAVVLFAVSAVAIMLSAATSLKVMPEPRQA